MIDSKSLSIPFNMLEVFMYLEQAFSSIWLLQSLVTERVNALENIEIAIYTNELFKFNTHKHI